MRKYKIFYLLALMVLISGCILPVRFTRVLGSGEVITESRRVSGFNAVELSGVGTLIIEQGSKESLEIIAEDNLIKYLNADVFGKTLRLSVDDYVSIEPTEEIIYHLTVNTLNRIVTSGMGNIEMDVLETPTLNFEISGAGNAKVGDLQADSFSLEISGLGNIEIGGSVEEQRVRLSGAGNYDGDNLQSGNASIEISGTGKAIIWAENKLDVELSGIGSLQYYGNPILTSEVSGLGSVSTLGEK